MNDNEYDQVDIGRTTTAAESVDRVVADMLCRAGLTGGAELLADILSRTPDAADWVWPALHKHHPAFAKELQAEMSIGVAVHGD